MSEQSKGVQGDSPSGRTRTDWEHLLAAYERREGTREAFCAAAGISVTSLDYWRRKLRGESSSSAPGFIELPIRGGDNDSALGWEMELALGDGVVLKLSRRARSAGG